MSVDTGVVNRWEPLFQSSGNSSEPYEGIPNWMRGPILNWTLRSFTIWSATHYPREDIKAIELFDMHRRSKEPLAKIVKDSSLEMMLHSRTDEELLELVDYSLSRVNEYELNRSEHVGALEEILSSSGSIWTVAMRGPKPGLLQRVSSEEKHLFVLAKGEGDQAGELLAEAWHAFYGVNPNFEYAHAQAVKAVEEALLPRVSPNNKKATLGTAIRELRKSGVLGGEGSPASKPLNLAMLPMLDTIWAQNSRHGGNGYEKPSKEETELVLLFAVTIIAALRRRLI